MSEIKALKTKIARMKNLLRRTEFTDLGFDYAWVCHFCGMTKREGHACICKLAKELR